MTTEPWAPVDHDVRVDMLRRLGQEHGLDLFIETGTAYGATVEALAGDFCHLTSIELHAPHFLEAMERLRHVENIWLQCGDSADVLPEVLRTTVVPALVYLDGHYSGPGTGRAEMDTPVRAELDAVLDDPLGHVIVIDDARGFGVWQDYPTAEWVAYRAALSGYDCRLELDAFVLTPAA